MKRKDHYGGMEPLAPALIPLEDLLGADAGEPAPRAGIARAAALAPEIDLRNGVTYSLLSCKSLLSRCDSERVPFHWSINPYRGCEFGCTYCLAPETPILHADLTWRPIGEVRPGDVLAGFDEYAPATGHRRFRASVVEEVWWSRKPTKRLVTERTEVITTAEHRWLQKRDFRWSRTDQLQRGRALRQLGVTPRLPLDDDYRLGYLCGVSLGDGTFRYDPSWRSDKLGFPQSYWRVAMADDEPLLRLVDYLGVFGISVAIRPFSPASERRRRVQRVEVRSLPVLRRLSDLQQRENSSPGYARGFLAGFFDAEGSNGDVFRISQKDCSVLDRVTRYAARFGFQFCLENYPGHVSSLRLTGPLRERLRFFSVCQPAIARKIEAVFGRQMETDPDRVQAVETGPVLDVVDIQTSTRTFYAAGLATHNCYARYTHEYMEIEGWQAFERKIFVKSGAAALLEEDLRRKARPGEAIAIGTATDPYQPAERRHRVTRSLLEVFARREGLSLSITTKSNLVLRDLDLLRAIARRNRVSVNITVTTLERRLARILEPRATRPDLRLRAVRELASEGIRVNMFLMPVMPWINDAPADLEALVRAAAGAGAAGLATQVLFLRASARRRFFPWLAEHFPRLLPRYRRLYAPPPGPYEAYCSELYERIRELKEEYGLAGRGATEELPAGAQGVLAL